MANFAFSPSRVVERAARAAKSKLERNDSRGDGSHHLDNAMETLAREPSKIRLKAAIRHIERHDNYEGSEPVVDDAHFVLKRAVDKLNGS